MKQFFWPDLDDFEETKKVARQGAFIAFFITLVTGIVTFLETNGYVKLLGLGPEAYIDAGLFLIIGIGIWFYSRIAAVAGLLLYAFEQYHMMQSGGPRVSIMAIIFVIGFINSIRACFEYHNMKAQGLDQTEAAPTGPVSILTGKPLNAGSAEAQDVPAAEQPQEKNKNPFSAAAPVMLVVILIALGAGGWYAYTSLQKKDEPASAPVSQISGTVSIPEVEVGSGSKTFRMRNGDVYRGQVMMEDKDLFIIKSGGKEEVLARKDVVAIE